ncbi:MAG TPA: hypothetical protein VHB48_03045 [Chitinophagaceae bacterium]|nr:hypothetical protein [Chitinophagaceae bacterium]
MGKFYYRKKGALLPEHEQDEAENQQRNPKQTKVHKSTTDNTVLYNTNLKESVYEKNKPLPLAAVPDTRTVDLSKFTRDELTEFALVEDCIRTKATMVVLMQEPLNIEEYYIIKNHYKMHINTIKELFIAIHNWPPLLKKNRSAYLAFLKFRDTEKNYQDEIMRRKRISGYRGNDYCY